MFRIDIVSKIKIVIAIVSYRHKSVLEINKHRVRAKFILDSKCITSHPFKNANTGEQAWDLHSTVSTLMNSGEQ